MAVSVLVSVFSCVAIVIVVGAAPTPSKEKGTDSGGKKLRNVIITSFGEMPYEPMESGGYYQSDIIPVNLNDEIEQQTMDVALRTGILVEDPNEKKITQEDIKNDDIEDETISTNTKRQAASESSSEEDIKSENKEDEFLSPQSRLYKRPTNSDGPSDAFLTQPLNYGYEFPKRQRGQVLYRLYPTPTTSGGDNNNREYYAELGEGWSLQDAEKFLKGRNYNILIVTPDHYPYNYPELQSRELPPPVFLSSAHNPSFYPAPSFGYKPGYYPNRGAAAHSYGIGSEALRRHQGGKSISRNSNVAAPSSLVELPLLPLREHLVPYAPARPFPEDYLRGV